MGVTAMQNHAAQRPRLRFGGRIGFILISVFIVFALLPGALLVLILVNEANDQARTQAIDQLTSVSEVKNNDLQRWLKDGQQILSLVMNDSRQYPLMVTIVQVPDVQLASMQQVNNYLAEKLKSQVTFTRFFIYTLSGQVRASTASTLIGTSVADQPYFTPGLKGDFIQPPYFQGEETAGKLVMYSTRGLTDNSGHIVGVLVGQLSMNELSSIMTTRVGMGKTGETYLVSPVAHNLVTASRFEGVPSLAASHSTGIDRALAGQNGSATYSSYRGTTVIGVYRWIPEIDVAMLAEVSESQALQAGNQLIKMSLYIALGIGLAAIATGTLVTLWITRPLSILTQKATLITAGDYTQRADIQSKNEIGQLANAFNGMTAKLADSIDTLETRVKERTHDLEVAREEAVKANQVKSQFLANMSHELRTPLNAILNFSDFVSRGYMGPVNQEQVEALEMVSSSGNHLLTLINDILDIAKIEVGKMDLFIDDVDINTELKSVVSIGWGLVKDKPIKLEIDVQENLPHISGDSRRLHQVFLNLLSNAVKFTPEGTITITAKCENEQILIAVHDTGVGVAPADQGLIFESFRQAESGLRLSSSGTGLGLPISKHFVEAHGGKLWLESELGKGSTFYITLPLHAQLQTLSTAQ